MNNVIPIEELLEKKFLIPAYQRGYRWEKEQVIDLLEDIKEFSQKQREENEFYCLQPLVVKKLDKSESCYSEYEVLDGQQRLTTILLILKNIALRESKIEEYTLGESLDSKLFEINYETRSNSKAFLSRKALEMKEDSNQCIDYHYIYQAVEVIDNWFKDKETRPNKRSIFDYDFIKNTKVIWYEVDKNENVIDAFTRLNMGKIKLTNAELIKSLFLNSSNFIDTNKESIRLKQLEISSEWDNIEYSLHNEELWGFIYSSKNKYVTRIEYILDLISGKDKKENKDKGENFTFSYFNKKLKGLKNKDKEDTIYNNWITIKRYFQIIEDWYNDKRYYHKVGYLLATGSDLSLIIEEWRKDRINFDSYINEEIKNKIKIRTTDELKKSLSEIVYKNGPVKNILLLHNILTICKDNNTYRFSFDKYKLDKWDVEHIHATADEINDEKKGQAWLDATREFIKNIDLFNRMEKYDIETFNKLQEEVFSYLGEGNDNIGNLCLLDSSTNRSYGCAVYADKRKTILDKCKNGNFIPICTQNVFNKFYSSNVENMIIWDKMAQNDYKDDIELTISKFLKNEL